MGIKNCLVISSILYFPIHVVVFAGKPFFLCEQIHNARAEIHGNFFAVHEHVQAIGSVLCVPYWCFEIGSANQTPDLEGHREAVYSQCLPFDTPRQYVCMCRRSPPGSTLPCYCAGH